MTDADDRQPTTPPPPPPAGDAGPPPRRRSVAVGPIVLIALGVLLLASNLGWFALGDLLRLLSYWPIALIAVGVDMLTNGRYRLPVVAIAVALTLVLWSGDAGSRGGGWWPIASITTASQPIEVLHPLDGARAGRVTLELGVGQVRVDGDARPGTLVSGTILTGRGEAIEEAVGLEGDTKIVAIRSEQERTGPFTIRGETRRWELSLSREVPVTLVVQAGVGQTTLDLARVRIAGIAYDGGVGESTVTLPDGSYEGSFDLGVGSTTIRIPRDAEVRIAVSSGLGRVSVPSGLSRAGDVYTSAGYEGASERISLRVNGGVGTIAIERR